MRNAVHNPARRCGFTLIEVMIALTICVVLMVALGTAVKAFANSLTANYSYTTCVQGARVAMVKMTAAARTSGTCLIAGTVTSGTVVGNTTLMIGPSAAATAADTTLDVYEWKSSTTQLVFHKNAANAPVYVLSDNITSAEFRAVLDTSNTFALNVQIKLVVGNKDVSYVLSNSAVCRKTRALPATNSVLPPF